MFPLVLILLLVGGGALLAASKNPGGAGVPPTPPQPPVPPLPPINPGFPVPTGPLPPAPPPFIPQPFPPVGPAPGPNPATTVVDDLPPELRDRVREVFMSPGDPGKIQALAIELQRDGFFFVATMLADLYQERLNAWTTTEANPQTLNLTLMYVRKPQGLEVRFQPSAQAPIVAVVPFRQAVKVAEVLPSGWARIISFTSNADAFVCHTCPEGGGAANPGLDRNQPPVAVQDPSIIFT